MRLFLAELRNLTKVLVRNVLIIDCGEIVKEGRSSDSKLVATLAAQMGYFPTFQWASSFNNLIDIASVGLIGTKAGFSTSLDVQIKQILDVSASALKSLADEAKSAQQRASALEQERLEMAADETVFVNNVRSGMVHDGRLDCVSSSGILGELGMGLERSGYYSEIYGPSSTTKALQATINDSDGKRSMADIDQMPIIVIKGFDSKDAGTRAVLWTAMADWAATLVENRVSRFLMTVFTQGLIAMSRLHTVSSSTIALPYHVLWLEVRASAIIFDIQADKSYSFAKQALQLDHPDRCDFRGELTH